MPARRADQEAEDRTRRFASLAAIPERCGAVRRMVTAWAITAEPGAPAGVKLVSLAVPWRPPEFIAWTGGAPVAAGEDWLAVVDGDRVRRVRRQGGGQASWHLPGVDHLLKFGQSVAALPALGSAPAWFVPLGGPGRIDFVGSALIATGRVDGAVWLVLDRRLDAAGLTHALRADGTLAIAEGSRLDCTDVVEVDGPLFGLGLVIRIDEESGVVRAWGFPGVVTTAAVGDDGPVVGTADGHVFLVLADGRVAIAAPGGDPVVVARARDTAVAVTQTSVTDGPAAASPRYRVDLVVARALELPGEIRLDPVFTARWSAPVEAAAVRERTVWLLLQSSTDNPNVGSPPGERLLVEVDLSTSEATVHPLPLSENERYALVPSAGGAIAVAVADPGPGGTVRRLETVHWVAASGARIRVAPGWEGFPGSPFAAQLIAAGVLPHAGQQRRWLGALQVDDEIAVASDVGVVWLDAARMQLRGETLWSE